MPLSEEQDSAVSEIRVGSSSAKAENCLVRIEANSVEQALQMMQLSFSGSEEAITLKIPSRTRREFEALFYHVRGEQ